MVCQAASQTRFRALKHESGIAGRATIIVRVIACFQPLQDCQAGESNGAYGLAQDLPQLESRLLTPNPFPSESQSDFPYVLGVKATPNAVAGSNQRRFLIFDQSENQTRYFLSPFSSLSQNPIIVPKTAVHVCDLHEGKQAATAGQISPNEHFIQGKSDENPLFGEGSEMHEDTEEINALLYSEENDEDGDCSDSEDDEVTSTGHSPQAIGRRSDEKREQFEETTEEVASSDGSTKRQRLLGGGYKVSSLVDTASSVKLDRFYKHGDGVKSSCAQSRIYRKRICSLSSYDQSTKGNIRMTLRILESILPGPKSNDPLVIIDEAINYLTCLKHKAKTMGVNYL
ncbi:unnamed protein product [Ilex paraguariensis]|uniref:Uncharacterized protein n=1 Tax=Ilex paraguariensis TaxID=185542 RepID=A0ABC8U2X4_9AQUA